MPPVIASNGRVTASENEYVGELTRALQQERIVLAEIVPLGTNLEDRFLQLTREER